ncbi:hypothetical protein LSAT2_020838 [Lamellibrachia satsuma]|nr:hypothetical protein LSAT2_020838 [Lamellibrachia satsuma]
MFVWTEKLRWRSHIQTYSDPTITHPNDIVATGEDSFYFTNYYKCDFIVEFFRGLSVGNVGLYDGRRGHILLAGISSPNGINTSPDGK